MCEIRTPFLVYTVNVTVQQLDFKSKGEDGQEGEDIWRTVGYVEIGPRRIGDNTARKHKGKSSGPQVCYQLYSLLQVVLVNMQD